MNCKLLQAGKVFEDVSPCVGPVFLLFTSAGGDVRGCMVPRGTAPTFRRRGKAMNLLLQQVKRQVESSHVQSLTAERRLVLFHTGQQGA